MVVLPSQRSRCLRKIVTGRSTLMRLVLAILAMLTEIVALTGVSVSLYAVSGSSTRAAVDKTEIRSIPKTTIVPRRYFTREPQVSLDDMPVKLPCQRKRTQPSDRMRQRVADRSIVCLDIKPAEILAACSRCSSRGSQQSGLVFVTRPFHSLCRKVLCSRMAFARCLHSNPLGAFQKRLRGDCPNSLILQSRNYGSALSRKT